MEWLKGMFTPVSERVKSPLYGTIFFCWLILNWKFWIALFFYNETVDGIDKIDYLTTQSDNYCRMYLYPLILTYTYLYLLPEIDIIVYKINEKNKTKKYEAKLGILSKSSVSGALYVNLLKEKEKLVDYLAEIRSEVEASVEEKAQLKSEKLNLQSTIQNLEERNKEYYSNFTNRNKLMNIMSDDWRCSYSFDSSRPKSSEIFYLTDGFKYFVRTQNEKAEHYFDIDFVDIDPYTKKIQFIKIEVPKLHVDKISRILKVVLTDKSTKFIKRYEGTEINILNPTDKANVWYEENRI